MDIVLKHITVRELTEGYEDDGEAGVTGYGGNLDIRPAYQREFVYKDKQRDAVIDTLTKGFPLNVMYWADRGDSGDSDTPRYEVMDGQQRTISICQYVDGDFSFKDRYFHNLQQDEQDQILDYQLTVYVCSGKDSEKLDWFQTINIAGAELTAQELRNAVYAGSFTYAAKRYFSRRDCAAHGLGGDYMSGEYIRQKYLETVLKWISGGQIESYMAEHQHDPNANKLWLYYTNVINWVKTTFPNYRSKIMAGQPWGDLYNEFGDKDLDSAALEAEIEQLILDEDVENKRGIYSYVLTRQERFLNIRDFSDKDKLSAYERQGGLCARGSKCKHEDNADGKKVFKLEEMEADHITPWREGGKTEAPNCQMLCQFDNRSKGGK